MEVDYDDDLNHTMVYTDTDIVYTIWWPREYRIGRARVYSMKALGDLCLETVQEHVLCLS